MSKFIALLLCFVLPVTSLAHDHGDQPEGSLEATIALYSKLVNLTPNELDEHSASTPSVKISGQTIWLNGAFWELTRQWIRVYYRSLQEECDNCIAWDEQTFAKEAEDQIARSFFAAKIQTPIMEGIEHIVVGAADVGARLGKFALVAKVAAEVAETILSKMAFLGGMHFFCHLIDAFILFGTRDLQTFTRAFSWAKRFDTSGIVNLVRFGFIAKVVRKAQNRVRFTVEPWDIDDEQLKDVDMAGPKRWFGWADDGKRAAWVKKISERSKRGKQASLRKREFLGGRMKRYLLLKGRKGGHATYMKGKTPMDKALNHNVLWILEVQENILQRSMLPPDEVEQTARESLAQTSALPDDDVRSGLAEEFSSGDPARAAFVNDLLKDVELIFNPQVPRKVRYFQAAALENLTSGFMYGMFSQILDEKGEMHGNSFQGIWNQARLRWKTARFARYMYEWSDYLKMAALQKNPEVLYSRKYEAMESFLKIMDYFKSTEPLLNAETTVDLDRFADSLSSEYDKLMTFRPWVEKRAVTSWLPKRPTCEELNEAVGQ